MKKSLGFALVGVVLVVPLCASAAALSLTYDFAYRVQGPAYSPTESMKNAGLPIFDYERVLHDSVSITLDAETLSVSQFSCTLAGGNMCPGPFAWMGGGRVTYFDSRTGELSYRYSDLSSMGLEFDFRRGGSSAEFDYEVGWFGECFMLTGFTDRLYGSDGVVDNIAGTEFCPLNYDFDILGYRVSGLPRPQPVPLPSALLLMLAGLAPLALGKASSARRRQSNQAPE